MRKRVLRALTCALVLGCVSVAYAASPPVGPTPPVPPTPTPLPAYNLPAPVLSTPQTPAPLPATDTQPLPGPNTVVGNAPGQFSVSTGGAANYSLPIQVPPGIAGMQPKLSLVYSSQGENGLFGVGWQLSGLSTITRCARTKASDGVQGRVNFDGNDRFCLDGKRLVLVSGGAYGAAGTEYRTEIETFVKVTAVGTAGNGPSSFVVKTKSGLTMEYGNSTDSRIDAVRAFGGPALWPAGTVKAWANNKVTDAAGNFMTISYFKSAVEFYPTRMDYAGNSVQLVPTTTPRSDVNDYYQSSTRISSIQRIGNVRTYVGTTLVADYQLAYQQSPNTKRSRLSTITQCNGAGKCLLPITVGWQDFAVGLETNTPWLQNSADIYAATDSATLIDMNADGLMDYVRTNSGASKVWWGKNNGNGLDTIVDMGFFDNIIIAYSPNPIPTKPPIAMYMGSAASEHILDLNGDGFPEYVRTRGDMNRVHVSFINPNTMVFNPPSVWTGDTNISGFGAYATDFVDVNGDGLLDYVRSKSDTNHVKVLLNTGTAFVAAPDWSAATAPGPSNYKSYWMDINGDGLPDYVRLLEENNQVMVSINNGGGLNSSVHWYTGVTGYSAFKTDWVDVNGDGLPDLVRTFEDTNQVVVFPNSGASFDWERTWTSTTAGWSAYKTYFIDMNGDGLPDYVRVLEDVNRVQVFMNNGRLFDAPVQWGSDTTGGWNSSTYATRLADVNGDGTPELIRTVKTNQTAYVFKNRSSKPDLVARIRNGALLSVAYKPLTNGQVYTKDLQTNLVAATYPQLDVQAPFYVVSSAQASNGIGGVNTTNYTYGGLKAELGTGRSMLGFRWMQTLDASTGVANITEFRQDYPYIGMASGSETRLVGASSFSTLKRTTNTLACKIPLNAAACVIPTGCHLASNATACASASASRYVPVVVGTEQTSWDLDGSALPITTTTTTTYGLDPLDGRFYGDVSQVMTVTSDGSDQGSPSQTMDYQYWPADSANWILGRVKQSTLTSAIPQ